QQHRAQPGVVFWLALFHPENLRRGEAWKHRIADRANGRFQTPDFRHDFVALGGCRSVAPEFGRANDLAVLVERNETVLLAAHADGLDFARARRRQRQRLANGLLRRVTPGVWMLFFGA